MERWPWCWIVPATRPRAWPRPLVALARAHFVAVHATPPTWPGGTISTSSWHVLSWKHKTLEQLQADATGMLPFFFPFQVQRQWRTRWNNRTPVLERRVMVACLLLRFLSKAAVITQRCAKKMCVWRCINKWRGADSEVLGFLLNVMVFIEDIPIRQ